MTLVTVWQKSSFSGGGDAANCVELAAAGSVVLLRESEAPTSVLSLRREALAGLVRQVKAGGSSGGFEPPVHP
ncbi:DUF397 domain-containing protein [Streptomyces varsoviensis]|uniref:DUF397 domain-containing protein n=1 Tax=Streptomyces varsoviensis TaxID=67373 RepID=UPI0009968A03|nr:DUF397 domain-containing protein [Streptomyces varsoviensis]